MSNTPPVIHECDNCHKKVINPLRCSACKNQFYCSKPCQTGDWPLHKLNCSLLPGGALNRAVVERVEGREHHRLLEATVESWKAHGVLLGRIAFAASQAQCPTFGITPTQRFDRLVTPEFKQLMAYRFPPSLDYPVYAGHPAGAPYTFKHQLILITRALWLDTVASSTEPNWELLLGQFVRQPRVTNMYSDERGWPQAHEDRGDLPAARGVRLFAPKVLAAPAKLSSGEYLGLATPLMLFWQTLQAQFPPAHPGRMTALTDAEAVVQGQLQGIMCPKLLDYALPER